MPAVSKAQQRFMGMVHAADKGETPASPEVAKVSADMKDSDAKDFASTKHAGLPDHVKEQLKSVVREVIREKNGMNEMSSNDVHFKHIMKMYDRGGSFTKKKIGAVVCKDPTASRKDVEEALFDADYRDIVEFEDELGLSEIREKYSSMNEEFKHVIHVDTPTQVVSKPIAAQIMALAKKGVRSNEIGLEMGFVGNQKMATDAFQKVKNQIYFALDKRNESVTEAAMNPVKKVVNAILKKHKVDAMKTTSTSVRGFHNIKNGGYKYDGNYFLQFYKVPQDTIEKIAAEMKKAGVKGVQVNMGNISADYTKTGLSNSQFESVNEGSHGMATKLLQSIVSGDSSRAEGTKMSKELAQHYIDWIRTSPFGKKNGNLPLDMLVKASFNWGIERGLDSKLKGELSKLKTTIKESINEAVGNDKSMAALVDMLSNSMENYSSESKFASDASKIAGFKNLKSLFKDVYNKYWDLDAKKRNDYTTKDWLNWLKKWSLEESVNEGLSKDAVVRTLTSDKNAYFLTKDGNGWILDITPKAAQQSTFHQKFDVKDLGKGHLGMKYKLSESLNEEEHDCGCNENHDCGCGGVHEHTHIHEDLSADANGIAGLTASRASAVEDFLEKNNINSNKLYLFLKKGNLKDRMDFVTALVGKPGNPIQKKVIKQFSN